jgi:hypothetical protein
MNEYKVYFNFDHQNLVVHILEAESHEDALTKVSEKDVYDFVDSRGKLIRVFLNKVTHIEVLSNKRTSAPGW